MTSRLLSNCFLDVTVWNAMSAKRNLNCFTEFVPSPLFPFSVKSTVTSPAPKALGVLLDSYASICLQFTYQQALAALFIRYFRLVEISPALQLHIQYTTKYCLYYCNDLSMITLLCSYPLQPITYTRFPSNMSETHITWASSDLHCAQEKTPFLYYGPHAPTHPAAAHLSLCTHCIGHRGPDGNQSPEYDLPRSLTLCNVTWKLLSSRDEGCFSTPWNWVGIVTSLNKGTWWERCRGLPAGGGTPWGAETRCGSRASPRARSPRQTR